jgi:hypothetical protein
VIELEKFKFTNFPDGETEAREVRELAFANCQGDRSSTVVLKLGCTLDTLEMLLKISVLSLHPSPIQSKSLGKMWGSSILVKNYWCKEKKMDQHVPVLSSMLWSIIF